MDSFHKFTTKLFCNDLFIIYNMLQVLSRKITHLSSVAGRKAPIVVILAPPGPPALAAA